MIAWFAAHAEEFVYVNLVVPALRCDVRVGMHWGRRVLYGSGSVDHGRQWGYDEVRWT